MAWQVFFIYLYTMHRTLVSDPGLLCPLAFLFLKFDVDICCNFGLFHICYCYVIYWWYSMFYLFILVIFIITFHILFSFSIPAIRYFGKHRRTRWNAAWWGTSSGSALFAKVKTNLHDIIYSLCFSNNFWIFKKKMDFFLNEYLSFVWVSVRVKRILYECSCYIEFI